MKVVPLVEKLRYDAERKTMIREGIELVMNPFDRSAVRAALDLRRPGETLTTISMGPPAAEAALRETLQLGADRALLVTDRVLAGSDTLVTSRTLARALERVGHDIVVAGRWTTDSETGQVGPEVAGLLGVPVVSSARSIVRDPSGSGLVVIGDTDNGWIRLRVDPPLVVSVGEKISKARMPSAAQVAAAQSKTVERLTASDLDLAAESVGLIGSPTVVASLRNEEPTRSPRLFSEGSIEDRVREAVEALRPILKRTVPLNAPLPPLASPLVDEREILLLTTGVEGRLEEGVLPAIAEVRRSLPGHWPSAVWVGGLASEAERRKVASAGATRAYHLPVDGSFVPSRTVALAVGRLLELRAQSAAGIFLSDSFGREVAGQLAARTGLGLTGDAVGMSLEVNGSILWDKPAFGGGVVAGIYSKRRPSLATVRPGVFRSEPNGSAGEETQWETVGFPAPTSSVVLIDSGSEIDERWGDLLGAQVILTVGMGIGGPERLPELRPTLERWHAAMGATRRVVDAGWVPRQLQIGLTGRSLAPALAVLVGVSGAPNHFVGWRRARALLAVNVNATAPVFRGVDVGIVGRWEEILPPLTEALAPLVKTL